MNDKNFYYVIFNFSATSKNHSDKVVDQFMTYLKGCWCDKNYSGIRYNKRTHQTSILFDFETLESAGKFADLAEKIISAKEELMNLTEYHLEMSTYNMTFGDNSLTVLEKAG